MAVKYDVRVGVQYACLLFVSFNFCRLYQHILISISKSFEIIRKLFKLLSNKLRIYTTINKDMA